METTKDTRLAFITDTNEQRDTATMLMYAKHIDGAEIEEVATVYFSSIAATEGLHGTPIRYVFDPSKGEDVIGDVKLGNTVAVKDATSIDYVELDGKTYRHGKPNVTLRYQ